MVVSVLVVYLHDGEADWELLLCIITYHILLAQEEINIQRMILTSFFLLTCGCSDFLAPFVEGTVFLALCSLASFVID